MTISSDIVKKLSIIKSIVISFLHTAPKHFFFISIFHSNFREKELLSQACKKVGL